MVEDFSSRRRYFAYCTACASYCWLLQSVLKWLIKLALTAGAYDIRSPGEFTGFFFIQSKDLIAFEQLERKYFQLDKNAIAHLNKMIYNFQKETLQVKNYIIKASNIKNYKTEKKEK